MAHDHHVESGPKERHRVEGPKNHYLTYIVSIILTMLAFAAVIYGGFSKAFLLSFLTVLALVQAAFQLFVWMHGKDRGHAYPIIGITFGFMIALTAVAAGIYWTWW